MNVWRPGHDIGPFYFNFSFSQLIKILLPWQCPDELNLNGLMKRWQTIKFCFSSVVLIFDDYYVMATSRVLSCFVNAEILFWDLAIQLLTRLKFSLMTFR
ncbi:unnamed protein product [Clavelina lepadiformis]|uniref:Uncharacterized protein n=1 Tax=Clavelina lepadiformis TaxID=159417 RepID=A0ABP0FBJ8_CLALP